MTRSEVSTSDTKDGGMEYQERKPTMEPSHDSAIWLDHLVVSCEASHLYIEVAFLPSPPVKNMKRRVKEACSTS